jgi:hypothetical protein
MAALRASKFVWDETCLMSFLDLMRAGLDDVAQVEQRRACRSDVLAVPARQSLNLAPDLGDVTGDVGALHRRRLEVVGRRLGLVERSHLGSGSGRDLQDGRRDLTAGCRQLLAHGAQIGCRGENALAVFCHFDDEGAQVGPDLRHRSSQLLQLLRHGPHGDGTQVTVSEAPRDVGESRQGGCQGLDRGKYDPCADDDRDDHDQPHQDFPIARRRNQDSCRFLGCTRLSGGKFSQLTDEGRSPGSGRVSGRAGRGLLGASQVVHRVSVRVPRFRLGVEVRHAIHRETITFFQPAHAPQAPLALISRNAGGLEAATSPG